MSSEEKYMELFKAGGNLVDGLIRLDGQLTPRLGFFQKMKLKKAKKLFAGASAECQNNPAPLLMLAKIEDRLGKHAEALDLFQKAWMLQPTNLILIVELSGAYGLCGMHQEAISVLLDGRKLHPDEPRILFNLGLSYLLEKQAEAAIEIFSRVMDIEPNFALNGKMLSYCKDVMSGAKPVPRNQGDIARGI